MESRTPQHNTISTDKNCKQLNAQVNSYFNSMREIYYSFLFTILSFIGTDLRDIDSKLEDCESRCDEDALMNNLANLQVLSPETIINLPIEDIDTLCRKLDDNIKVIDKFLQTCKAPPPEDLYMSLIQGVKILNIKMCSANSEFLKRFLIYYPCLHELKNDFDGCNGPADWNEEPNDQKLCLSYKTIVDCYYVETAKVCGLNAAATMKELVREIIDNVICIKCREVRIDPYVADPMPEKYIKLNQTAYAKGRTIHIYFYAILLNLLCGVL